MEKNPWESSEAVAELNSNPIQPVAPRKNTKVWDIHYRRVLSVWPWMIPAGLLFLLCTWVWLRYQVDRYQVSASMIVSEQSQIANAALNAGFSGNRDPINDNIARMRSPNLLKQLVDTLGLNYHAIRKGKFKHTDLYGKIQWKVINNESASLSFEVFPNQSGFKWKTGSLQGDAAWGKPFRIQEFDVIIDKKTESVGAFSCYTTDSWNDAINLSGSIIVTPSKVSNLVQLNTSDTDPQRAADILNKLITVYNQSILSGKRSSQEQGLQFIEARLLILANQLDSIESVMAQFKADKGLILNGSYLLGKVIGVQDQLDQFRLNERLFENSESVFRNPSVPQAQRSLPGVMELSIQTLLSSYLNLTQQRDQLLLTLTSSHPKVVAMDRQIQNARQQLEASLDYYKRSSQVQKTFLQEKETTTKQLYQLTPWEEKRLNEIARFQGIKLSQFMSMLQRKEDYALSLASISVETFIVRPALVPSTPIGMAPSQLLLIAFFSGVWVPFLIVLIAEFMNNKIITRNQLQQMLTPPVVAELDQVAGSEKAILQMKRKDRSVFGEQIRSLRAGLRYYAPPDRSFYILLTSSMSGEGKSFISANLAASFALQGKRVALLELDLRRPKLSKRFAVSQQDGLSSFLIGKIEVSDLAIRVSDEMHLDLFPAGVVPPNPSELLSSDKMLELKGYLDAHYDVVVIDTPPNGIVADAQLLQSWIHISLIITRFRMTVREQIKDIEDWYHGGLFKPMAVILNGVSIQGYYGNRYGYYYAKRKYGYKYYAASESATKNNKD
jgi:tyrosine-protein kinase Etk/Wzc